MALRAKIRAYSLAVKDKGTSVILMCYIVVSLFLILYRNVFLVYWGEEEGVSVHLAAELDVEGERAVGDSCIVRFGKSKYTGRIAYFGEITATATLAGLVQQ